jgi:hypothetical protein
MHSAFVFFGAVADVFLSLMLWFILDDEKAPTFFIDGDRVYVVANVIKPRDSINSVNCDDSD